MTIVNDLVHKFLLDCKLQQFEKLYNTPDRVIKKFDGFLIIQGPEKKYFKRGDLAAKQEEEYWKRHKRLKSENGVSYP